MKKTRKIIGILLAALLIVTLFAACKENTDEETSPNPSPSPSSSNSGTTSFNYSENFDDNGYWKGIRALDYVTLPDYSAIVIPYDVHTVTDAAVEEAIEDILLSYATYDEITDRAVEDGDYVNIDFVGSIDGVEFDGGNTEGAGTDVTAGSDEYIDDFLTQIIGHMPGETLDVIVTFPEVFEDNPDLAGKEALFVTTINYIQGDAIIPELTDEFVSENLYDTYGVSTVAELNEYVFESLVDNIDNEISNYIVTYLEDNSTVEEPPAVILEFLEAFMVDWYQQYANYYGVDLETLLYYLRGDHLNRRPQRAVQSIQRGGREAYADNSGDI